MESLLTQWEQRFNGQSPIYEKCERCRHNRLMIEFYDNHKRRKLCKNCRDYNKIYCKKYFTELKEFNKKIEK